MSVQMSGIHVIEDARLTPEARIRKTCEVCGVEAVMAQASRITNLLVNGSRVRTTEVEGVPDGYGPGLVQRGQFAGNKILRTRWVENPRSDGPWQSRLVA